MNTVELRALEAEIKASPACAGLIVTNDMGQVAGAAAMDQAIADIINASRPKKVVRREVGDGAISLALGIRAGSLFLMKLRMQSEAAIVDGMSDEQIELVAVCQQAWRSLMSKSFDVGDESVREALDGFVGRLPITEDQVAVIKALAEVEDPVTGADVSRALRGPWGDEPGEGV